MMPQLAQGRILKTNRHVFEPRGTQTGSKVVKTGQIGSTGFFRRQRSRLLQRLEMDSAETHGVRARRQKERRQAGGRSQIRARAHHHVRQHVGGATPGDGQVRRPASAGVHHRLQDQEAGKDRV